MVTMVAEHTGYSTDASSVNADVAMGYNKAWTVVTNG